MVLMVVSQMQVMLYLEVPMVCLDCIIGCTHYAKTRISSYLLGYRQCPKSRVLIGPSGRPDTYPSALARSYLCHQDLSFIPPRVSPALISMRLLAISSSRRKRRHVNETSLASLPDKILGRSIEK